MCETRARQHHWHSTQEIAVNTSDARNRKFPTSSDVGTVVAENLQHRAKQRVGAETLSFAVDRRQQFIFSTTAGFHSKFPASAADGLAPISRKYGTAPCFAVSLSLRGIAGVFQCGAAFAATALQGHLFCLDRICQDRLGELMQSANPAVQQNQAGIAQQPAKSFPNPLP